MKLNDLFSVKEIPTEDYFDTHFFNSKNFLLYQSSLLKKEIITIGIYLRDNDELLAYFSLSVDSLGLFNPITGSFGGFVCKKNTDSKILNYLVSESVFLIRNKFSLKNIFFKLPPFAFENDTLTHANILHRNGFKLFHLDLNHHINIGNHNDYFQNLGETKRKIYRRLISNGAIFKTLNLNSLPDVYGVIEKNRKHQNYPLTMSLDSLQSLVNNFPKNLYLFGVFIEKFLIASAVCIKVSNEYLYVFYWGEDPSYRRVSPVTMLAIEIHQFCYRNQFKVLDLGTSSSKSEINNNLAEFKTSLGCLATPKLSFSLF